MVPFTSNVLVHFCLTRQSSSGLQGKHQHKYQHGGKALALQWSKYPFEVEKSIYIFIVYIKYIYIVLGNLFLVSLLEQKILTR